MKKNSQKQIIDNYDYLSNAASTTDCTGLIPSLPQDESELESYNSTYHFLPPDQKKPADKSSDSSSKS